MLVWFWICFEGRLGARQLCTHACLSDRVPLPGGRLIVDCSAPHSPLGRLSPFVERLSVISEDSDSPEGAPVRKVRSSESSMSMFRDACRHSLLPSPVHLLLIQWRRDTLVMDIVHAQNHATWIDDQESQTCQQGIERSRYPCVADDGRALPTLCHQDVGL